MITLMMKDDSVRSAALRRGREVLGLLQYPGPQFFFGHAICRK